MLNCDIDVLRTLVGGWEDDYSGAGGRIRTAALALMTAYLRGGDDVVLPQRWPGSPSWSGSSGRPGDADAAFVEVMLTGDVEASVARFNARRPPTSPTASATDRAADGGDEVCAASTPALLEVAAARPDTVRVATSSGDVDGRTPRSGRVGGLSPG